MCGHLPWHTFSNAREILSLSLSRSLVLRTRNIPCHLLVFRSERLSRISLPISTLRLNPPAVCVSLSPSPCPPPGLCPFSRVPHRASSSLLYSFAVSSRPFPPSLVLHLPPFPVFPSSSRGWRVYTRSCAARAASCVSLSIARTFSLVWWPRAFLARSLAFLPPPRPPPTRIPFGLCRFLRALRFFLQSPRVGTYVRTSRRRPREDARRGGARRGAERAKGRGRGRGRSRTRRARPC